MKLLLRQIHHHPSEAFNDLIKQQLDTLGEQLQIDEARVVIERRLDASPSFHVSIHLVTPGPDVSAEMCDHTVRAAFEKTVSELGKKIEHRTQKRLRRDSPQPHKSSGARIH